MPIRLRMYDFSAMLQGAIQPGPSFDLDTSDHLFHAKHALRQSMRATLRTLTTEQCAVWSAEIGRRLMQNDAWLKSGGVVALFSGFKTEPDLLPLLPWMKERGLRAAFFAIEGNGLMSPYLVRDVGDLQTGKFGVLEPRLDVVARLNVSDLGVILTPGLAFGSDNGMRLGQGKGHYDRLFGNPECKALRVGVAFDIQILPTVPAEPHDAAMNALVSESALRFIPDGALAS